MILLTFRIFYHAYVGLSAKETVGDDAGEVDEPAIPDDEDEDDNTDGKEDLILMLFVSNSFGGGLITICASGTLNVVSL